MPDQPALDIALPSSPAELLRKHKTDPEAVQFITDMLEQ